MLEKCHLVQDGHSETRGEAPSVFGRCGHGHSGHGIGGGGLRTSAVGSLSCCRGLDRPFRTCACCRRSEKDFSNQDTARKIEEKILKASQFSNIEKKSEGHDDIKCFLF